uniref:Uncharacterized protein n=1 Tax=Rhizophora mucronata TaxID=61149 RepID=A0A2P2KDL9_RHIMU
MFIFTTNQKKKQPSGKNNQFPDKIVLADLCVNNLAGTISLRIDDHAPQICPHF